MRTTVLSLAALATMTACGPGADAVWLINYSQGEVTDFSSSCETNFETSECPEAGDPGEPGPWTSTDDRSQSDGAFFGQILDAPSGEKVMVVAGDVYVGVKDGGNWVFTWESFDEGTTENKHESGYVFSSTVDRRVEYTITLDLKGGTATGDLKTVATETETVLESDAWLSEEVGFEYGRIFDQAPVYLDGDRTNTNQESDCNGNECSIKGTSSQTFTAKLSAIRTDAGRDGYIGVQEAGRTPGYDN